MKSPQELFRLWFELECIGLDNGRLFRISGLTCDDIEHVVGVRYLGDVGGLDTSYFRLDLPDSIVEQVRSQMGDDVLGNEDDVWGTLVRGGLPRNELRREITYTFVEAPPIDVSLVACLAGEMVRFSEDGRVISRAWSVRSNIRSCEIAVETHGDFRRRGYGKQVVSAWVKSVLDSGKVPIYSHRKGNLESAALARSVGAVPFVEVVSYH